MDANDIMGQLALINQTLVNINKNLAVFTQLSRLSVIELEMSNAISCALDKDEKFDTESLEDYLRLKKSNMDNARKYITPDGEHKPVEEQE